MDKLLHLKFWYWLGAAGTAIGGGLFMGLFAEDSAEAAWGEPAPEIAITYERLNGYKILAIAGIMIAIGLIAKGRDFAKLAAAIGGIMLLVFIVYGCIFEDLSDEDNRPSPTHKLKMFPSRIPKQRVMQKPKQKPRRNPNTMPKLRLSRVPMQSSLKQPKETSLRGLSRRRCRILNQSPWKHCPKPRRTMWTFRRGSWVA